MILDASLLNTQHYKVQIKLPRCSSYRKGSHRVTLNYGRQLYFYLYYVPSISFETFKKIIVDSWKFTMSLLYILWDIWQIFMISGSNEQLQQQLEYTLLKPDCHSWWISKMQSVLKDTLEERYAIKFCFKLRKKWQRNVWNASNFFWTFLDESSISFWVA